MRISIRSSIGIIISILCVNTSFAQDYYTLNIHNNFAPTEFYGASVPSSDIYLVTNFGGNYTSLSSNNTTQTNTAGNWTTIQLSDIQSGQFNLQRAPGGTRMYAVLSSTAPAAGQPSSTTSSPYAFFEWSFGNPAPSNNPGVLDFSWIDRYDFPNRMVATGMPNNTHTGVSSNTQVFGARPSTTVGTSQIGQQLASYVSNPNYSWLATAPGGFSQSISYGNSTGAVGWTTRNSSTIAPGWASTIKSFTNELDRIQAQALISSNATGNATLGTDKNWTKKGFRVGYPTAMNDPETGTVSGSQWTAYVNFSGNLTSGYTLEMSEIGLYDNFGNSVYTSNATYSFTQAQGMLEAVWTSSLNSATPPTWLTNMGGTNVMYEVYNAIASGVIHRDEFLNDTPLPAWTGYSPRIVGVDTYNYEIFTAGAPVDGLIYPAGLQGYLTGDDMVTMLEDQLANDMLVNPYFLELMKVQEQTPAYLYPSQDSWNFVGTDTTLGIQPQPLNGQSVWGDNVTLDWYLGNNVAVPEPSSVALLGAAALTLAGAGWRRRRVH
jgi:hypothetical protein